MDVFSGLGIMGSCLAMIRPTLLVVVRKQLSRNYKDDTREK